MMDRQREVSIASSGLYQSDTDDSIALAEQSHGTKRPKEQENTSLEDGALPGKRRRIDASELQTPPLSPRRCELPNEVWQVIFSHLDPASLGKLLLTCKLFYAILANTASSATPGNVRMALDSTSDGIWKESRRKNLPLMPEPLMGKGELEMWQLIGGRQCQYCMRQATALESPPGLWNGGPGEHSIRIIWPFGIRCCGACLKEHSQTDTSLLLSTTTDSVFAPALPFTFLTQSIHVVSASLISLSRPENLHITKRYFQGHIDDIQRELEQVRSTSTSATAEWIAALSARGKGRMKDSARWESFESEGGFSYIFPHARGVSLQPETNRESIAHGAVPTSENIGNYATFNAYEGYHGYPPTIYPPPWTKPLVNPSSQTCYSFPPCSQTYSHAHASPPVGIPFPHQPQPQSALLGSKNSRDASEAKQARKNEIERRCADLDDPIPPNVLQHMESFRAACQISAPMTESAWEVLKPRLLAQRDSAEQIEVQRQQNLAALQVKIEDRRQRDANQKEIKEILDREWDEAQKPIRAKLSKYADDIILRDWSNGRSVTKDNSASFASDILSKVRIQFYHDTENDGEAAHSIGQLVKENCPTSPPIRKLVLENMKWVFDHKIKSITEQYRKELFVCNGEGCEGNFKAYGFEGVIQHYGAKHTSQFSKGNVIVHWQSAEWPQELPFHADPAAARDSYISGLGTSTVLHSEVYLRPSTITPQYGLHDPFGYPPATSGSQPYTLRSAGSPLVAYNGNNPLFHLAQRKHAQGWSQQNPTHESHQALTGQVCDAPNKYPSRLYHNSGKLVQRADLETTDISRLAIFGGNTNLPDAKGRANIDRVDEVAQAANYCWNLLSDLESLPDSVKIYVTFSHVISGFKKRFSTEPDIDIFIAALASHPLMTPLLSVSGLRCRVDRQDARLTSPSLTSSKQEYDHSISSFLSRASSIYFKDRSIIDGNLDRPATTMLSWTLRLIDIPSLKTISSLAKAEGMDEDKLHLLTQAFPDVFEKSTPRIQFNKHGHLAQSVKTEIDDHSELAAALNNPDPDELASNEGSRQRQEQNIKTPAQYSDARSNSFGSPLGKSPALFGNVREDQYDPTHPAIELHNRIAARSNRRRRTNPDESFEAAGQLMPRLYIDPVEVYDTYYEPLPTNQYVRAVPVNPIQTRPVRLYYSDKPDFDYLPVEREYSRRAPSSPHIYYRDDNVRISRDGPRYNESDCYMRSTSNSRYANSDRYLEASRLERTGAYPSLHKEGSSREEEPVLPRDRTTEADAGYRSRSHLPSERPPASLTALGDGIHDAHTTLASGAPTPAPLAPRGAQSPLDGPAPRNVRLTSPDSGYRGRSLVNDSGFKGPHDTSTALLRASFSDEKYRRSDTQYRSRNSKYGRYEAQRRRLQHEQSSSPAGYPPIGHSDGEIRFVRDRDFYYKSEPRYVRVDDRARRYSPPGTRYLSGDTFVDEQGRSFEYVRFREPYLPQRYVSGHAIEPEYVEYGQHLPSSEHGSGPLGAPVYQSRHYVPFGSDQGHVQRKNDQSHKPTSNREMEEDDYEPPNIVGSRKA